MGEGTCNGPEGSIQMDAPAKTIPDQQPKRYKVLYRRIMKVDRMASPDKATKQSRANENAEQRLTLP